MQKPLKLQEFFFRTALLEIGIVGGDVKLDHKKGLCFHPNLGTVPLVFPIALVEQVRRIPKKKTLEYFFMGTLTEARNWLLKYDNVCNSDYGRDPERKYEFHIEYFEKLCACKFALAPTGDCPWSYRFFEAIMCYSIPVIGDNDPDVFCKDYFHYRDSEPKEYIPAKCHENYLTFINQHTFRSLAT